MTDISAFVLGETETPVVLATAEEDRETTLAMVRQGRQSVKILSHCLEPALYDTEALAEAISALVRRNRYARVLLLVAETDPLVKRGHRLLDLCHRLASFIQIRRLSETHREFNQAFLIVDDCGVIHRRFADRYEGRCTFNSRREARDLARLFMEMWEAGDSDPALLRLHI